MTDIPFNWPQRGDQPFKPSVPSTDHTVLDAFVMPFPAMYSEGFQRAADMIVASAHTDDLNADDLFFPVAYLYRHHLELVLKDLIGMGETIGAFKAPIECPSEPCPSCGHRKERKDWRSEHNLHRLWNKAKELLMFASPEYDWKPVEHVILEFHRLDPTGQAFRYASDKKGATHLQDAPDRVDLENLKTIVDGISNCLDAAGAIIDQGDPGPP